MTFELGRNPLIYIDLVYNIANIDCNVERSGNDRGLPRLEPELREKMLAMSSVEPKALRKRRPSFRRTGEEKESPTTMPTKSEQVRMCKVLCVGPT